MMRRRDFALLAASGAAVAAAGDAMAEALALKGGRTYKVHGVCTTTIAAEPFDNVGVPSKPLWQTHSTGESTHVFLKDGSGRVKGQSITQIGAIFDKSFRNDLKLLAAEEAKFEYAFRYFVGKDNSVKLFIIAGSYIREVTKGRRKGIVENVGVAGDGKTPASVGHFSNDMKRLLLKNPTTLYLTHIGKTPGAGTTYSAKQWEMAGEFVEQ